MLKQKGKDKHCRISLICRNLNKTKQTKKTQLNKQTNKPKHIKKEIWFVVSRGRGGVGGVGGVGGRWPKAQTSS